MNRRNAIVAALIVLLLAGCSAFPVPVRIDLKARLGDAAQGSFEEPVGAGSNATIDARYPTDEGQCVDFSDASFAAKVEKGSLTWNGEVTYDGPALTGKVQAQLYASSQASTVWQPSSKVGPAVTVRLDKTTTHLAGTAVLNKDQVKALNDRNLCWGLHLTGTDVSAAESGTATISYSISKLVLAAGVSVLSSAGAY